MTVKEKLTDILIKNGLSDLQASEIIEQSIPVINAQSKQVANYEITWDSPADDYPEFLYNIWFITMKPIALKWIEENKPQAWFKPMFQ